MSVNLYNNDCLEVLKTIPDKSVDLVVTDCPYRIIGGGCTTGANGSPSGILNRDYNKVRQYEKDIETGRNVLKGTKHVNLGGCLDDSIAYTRQGKLFKFNDINFNDWLPDVYRVLKDNTHCYIMINARNLKELQQKAEDVGFIFQQIIIWNKGNTTPNRYYLNAYEMILMLRKGKAISINNMGTKNILDVKNIRGNKKQPTEKPVELLKILIENSSNENDLILDPFMGAGSTGIACKELNRNFIGIEIDEKYFNVAKDRMNELEFDLSDLD